MRKLGLGGRLSLIGGIVDDKIDNNPIISIYFSRVLLIII